MAAHIIPQEAKSQMLEQLDVLVVGGRTASLLRYEQRILPLGQR
jgi:hypothetical protein